MTASKPSNSPKEDKWQSSQSSTGTRTPASAGSRAPQSSSRVPEPHSGLQDAQDVVIQNYARRLSDALRRVSELEEQYQAAHDLLVRLRQWDMMVGGIGADGEHHEATADAPYWRSEIDRVLVSSPASRSS